MHLQVHLTSIVCSVNLTFPIAGCPRRLSSGVLAASSGMINDFASGGLLDSSQGVQAVTCLDALIAVLRVKFVNSSWGVVVSANRLYW